ncbi:competence protein ComK [Lysinibacillus sp. NPDC048646]|uniref:competence protein ComK n=1 Tax=Lysinibacillus sp. NPDC048646 TaxID=3390574 RepID=UPI003CFCB111
MSTNYVNGYLMSFNTYLLQPIQHDSKIFTRVIDKHNELIVTRKPMHVLRKSCLSLGTTYEAAKYSAKRFFGNQHKLPIVVAYDYGFPCIFLPTYSPNSIHNTWIGLHAISNIIPNEIGCIVTLKNGMHIELTITYASISKQFVNASMLYKHYMGERKQLSQDAPYHPPF